MPLAPYVQDADFTLYVGDVRDVLAELPDASVDCVVTSPPYWGLRDYGTGQWDGGDLSCDHSPEQRGGRFASPVSAKQASNMGSGTISERDCKCGARRVDQQLGLEATPDLYVANMVAVFREVRWVLAAHGTCWVNLGSSYASGMGSGSQGANGQRADRTFTAEGMGKPVPPGYKPKDMVPTPWMVAMALQQDGWYLRADIIWSKPNPMPESVTDRPTKAHEYVFLLSKGPRYFFDQEAVREPAEYGFSPTTRGKFATSVGGNHGSHTVERGDGTGGRNVRSVWEIATQPYPEAHFATYPEELVRRCIVAGCPEWVCGTCGKPRERITSTEYVKSAVHGAGSVVGRHEASGQNNYDGAGMPRLNKQVTTDGWSDCGHDNYRPGRVLDPFMGSGTTALVARRYGRHSIGIELNETYAAMCAKRLQQLSLLAEGTA